MKGSAVNNNTSLAVYIYVIRNRIVLVPSIALELAEVNVARSVHVAPARGVRVGCEDNVQVWAIGYAQVFQPQETGTVRATKDGRLAAPFVETVGVLETAGLDLTTLPAAFAITIGAGIASLTP